MANLKQTDKLILERQFEMVGGYVLDFSNQSFQQFILDECKLDIYDSKYSALGDSKAKRLRMFWQLEPDKTVGVLITELLAYWRMNKRMQGAQLSKEEAQIFNDCLRIAHRLRGVVKSERKSSTATTEEEFLKKEFGNISIEKLAIDGTIQGIITERLDEIQKTIKSECALSVVILCGSVLEGILLGMATSNMKDFNQSIASPKNKETGKVLLFHEWTLSNFIDVSYDIGLLGLDVKKFSHVLRDFRNYIHPYQQMNSGFSLDIDTARISWQVLQAAISDLLKNKKCS